jgi:hypothetical protein
MKISSKTILISKRDFEIKSNKNNADSSIRRYNAREEFEIIEYVKTDNEYTHVFIRPLSKNRDSKKYHLLYKLNSLRNHFYFLVA